ELQDAVRRETLDRAAALIEDVMASERPPLARLRSVVGALVELGAERPLDVPLGPPSAAEVERAAERLEPLADQLARAAGLDVVPAGSWRTGAVAALVSRCLGLGWSS